MDNKELSRTFNGTLAEYVYSFCKKHSINRIDSMTSHYWLSIVAVDWFSDEMQAKHMTRSLQRRIMNAIRYTKKGSELFVETGQYMDYTGMRGFNKPKIYALRGTEEDPPDFHGTIP